jgi:hypothetical protein
MKKAMLLAVAVLFLVFAPKAYAFYPYVALYGDTLQSYYDDPGDPTTGHFSGGGYTHSQCSVYIPAPYYSIEMWVWFKPDPGKGMAAGEYKITYPSSTYIIQGGVYSNPLNQVELGTLPLGISVSIGAYNCQYDWYWTHWQEIVVKTLTARLIQIVGHPANGGHIYLASCEEGFPLYDCTVLNHLYLNQACNIATHDASWGAIKNLYTE